MIPVWLYSSDGRALYCVYVPTPMPRAVTYAGVTFTWAGTRYEETPHYYATAEVPDSERLQADAPDVQGPEALGSLEPEALRAQLTQRLDTLLGRWWLGAGQRAVLSGVRAYVTALDAVELTKLGRFLPQTLGGEPCAT